MASNVTVNIQANTDPMVRKLRAIAEHATALADELEAIDAESAPPADDPYRPIPCVALGEPDPRDGLKHLAEANERERERVEERRA